jgi:high-affinity iron transporter
MWQGFLIALREGIESLLIVALTLAYLKKTGRARLARAVYAGIAASVAACIGAGALLQQATNQPLWEGVLAAASTVLVGSFLVYMLRSAKTMKATMERQIERAAAGGAGGAGGVFLFTVLMITREGMETTLLLSTALFQMRSAQVFGGLGLGLVAAAVIAFAWTRLGRRVNLGLLLNVSAVFLGIFLLQLCLYSVHELAEAGLWAGAQTVHDLTEVLGPDGAIGHAMTYALAAVPLAWLALAVVRGRRPTRVAAPPAPPPVSEPVGVACATEPQQ